jgi:hypothetical protein
MGYNFKPACGLTLYTVKSQGGLHLYYLQHAELVLNLIATEIIYNPAWSPPPTSEWKDKQKSAHGRTEKHTLSSLRDILIFSTETIIT